MTTTSSTDVGLPTESIPPRDYSDPAVLETEWTKVFDRHWHYIGSLAQVEKPGDRIVGEAGRIPIVVTRDKQGELHALLNVCRHRWHPVARESGNDKMLSCQYHSWTYRLDGTLAGAPGTLGDRSFDRTEYSLRKARLEVVGPWIFVNADESAPSLRSELSDCLPFVQKIEERMRGYVFAERTEYRVKANWKLFMDNTAECYHCSSIHADSISQCFLTDRDNYQVESYANAWSQFGPAIEQPAELNGEAAQGLHFMFTFPSNFMGVDDVVGFAGTAQPVSPTETRIIFDAFRNPVMSDESYRKRGEMYDMTFAEDLSAIELVQPNMASDMVPVGRLMAATEPQVINFQQRLRQAMG